MTVRLHPARSLARWAVPVLALMLAGPAGAADQPKGKTEAAPAAAQPTPRTARVAQGGRVELKAPAQTGEELASRRPGYQNLKPRPRTNRE